VIVPAGGEVAVIGWVYNPGHFKVRQGLTATAAIGDAGGLMYAADQSKIRILRSTDSGLSQSIDLDWAKIEAGREPDPLVQGNDTIEVFYSKARILPYIVYNILNSKIGVALPAF
jgi:protein involved in polysaccharide export with SLBB domain